MSETDLTSAPVSDNGGETVSTTPSTGAGAPFDFNSVLSPEYKGNASFAKFGGDLNKLAGSYLQLESFMGSEKIPVPKDENDAEAWGMYRKAFGVPEKADGYELTAVEGFDSQELKQFAHSLNLNQKQAQALQDKYLGELMKIKESAEQEELAEFEEAKKSLKAEWGVKYDSNIKLAQNAIKQLVGQEAFSRIEQKYGNDPDLIRAFSKAGAALSEGSIGGFVGQKTNSFALTPAEAQQELDKITNDPMSAYNVGVKNQRNNPDWARQHNQTYVSEEERLQAVEHVRRLMEMCGG